MNQQSAPNAGTRTARMHAGSRFGDVLVGLQVDSELRWYFNDAAAETRQPSSLSAAYTGRGSGSVAVFESNVEAGHAARKISDRLESIGARAAYLHAHMTRRTSAPSTTAWLEELVAKCSKDLVGWRCDAFRALEQAVKAYEQARGKDDSVVPPELP